MKKTFALLILSVALVTSAAPAFAGVSAPCWSNEKFNMREHRQRTEWLSPDRKSAIAVPYCYCIYDELDGRSRTYDGPSDKCPYCTNRDKFY
ncbi:MAG: hypothetical protein Q4C78_02650 [Synergistaceae bacterium]|nr:hypothetical protein [Synergistaceae bacterium]